MHLFHCPNMVPVAGVEPARGISPMDFESTSSAIPTSRLSIDAFYLTKIGDRLQLFFCLF